MSIRVFHRKKNFHGYSLDRGPFAGLLKSKDSLWVFYRPEASEKFSRGCFVNKFHKRKPVKCLT